MPDHLGWKLTDLTCEELYVIQQLLKNVSSDPTSKLALDKVTDAVYRKERRMPNVATKSRELGLFEKATKENFNG